MKNSKSAVLSEKARFNRCSLKRSGGLWLVPVLLLASCGQQNPANNTAAQIGTNTLNVADAAIAGGDPNMALSVSQSILTSDPGNVQALEHEGNAYYALNRCPAAIAAYQLALEHDPKASAAETGQGRCLLKTDPSAAEQAFLRAVQDDPGNANALNDLGIARDLQGNFAGAAAAYQKALLADPSLTAVEVNLGLSLALSGNGPLALQYLGPLATSPQATPKIRQDYAAALVATGRVSEARQVLAVDLPPDQVNSAINGFTNLIQQSQFVPPPAPAAPTVQRLPAPAPVSATPLPQSANIPAAPPAPLAAAVPLPSPMVAQIHPISSPTPAPEPAPASAPAMASTAAVQLGALNSHSAAQRVWTHLARSSPALFNGRTPQIDPVTLGSKTFYRLRVGGFQNKVAAAHFCNELQAAGHICTPADF